MPGVWQYLVIHLPVLYPSPRCEVSWGAAALRLLRAQARRKRSGGLVPEASGRDSVPAGILSQSPNGQPPLPVRPEGLFGLSAKACRYTCITSATQIEFPSNVNEAVILSFGSAMSIE